MTPSVESFEESTNRIPVYHFAKTHSDVLSWEGFVESVQAFVNAVFAFFYANSHLLNSR
ncbi:6582_t:CDS:2 [Racocetra fulgida]|uniref:6582_t:CDS:1 n=1 Tax=Racocetra fulgida TaxID=60492 RepID=A0A9N8VK23_9GLOM|nr:6582_t:CDS:2 [Racocetra fulgida]